MTFRATLASIHQLILVACLAAIGLGCAETDTGGTGGGATGGIGGSGGAGGSAPTRPLVITADWLNQSLTLLDYDILIDGQSDAESAIVRTIDLSEWEPGPLELEVTPDGTTAVVAVGPGFFNGFSFIGSPTVPPGGTLLFVDLETGTAEAVATEDVPLGVAISPDGAFAYTANYGEDSAPGDSLSVIDVATRQVVEEVMVGSRPEQVRLSPDGTLGAVNVTGADGIRVFQTADVTGTLTEVVPTGNDPSDLLFVDGNNRLVVANSAGFNFTLVDTSDPTAPTAIQSFFGPAGGGVPYGLSALPGGAVLAPLSPITAGLPANLTTIEVDGDILRPSLPEALAGGAFPLNAAVDAEGAYAFVAHVGDNTLSIVDLATGQARGISWLSEPGPTYVVFRP